MTNFSNQLFPAIFPAAVPLTFFATAFALGETSTTSASPLQTSQLIQKLEADKSADRSAALDPDVSPFRRKTFVNQMNKADCAAKELRHGFPIPQAGMTDALWAAPSIFRPKSVRS